MSQAVTQQKALDRSIKISANCLYCITFSDSVFPLIHVNFDNITDKEE